MWRAAGIFCQWYKDAHEPEVVARNTHKLTEAAPRPVWQTAGISRQRYKDIHEQKWWPETQTYQSKTHTSLTNSGYFSSTIRGYPWAEVVAKNTYKLTKAASRPVWQAASISRQRNGDTHEWKWWPGTLTNLPKQHPDQSNKPRVFLSTIQVYSSIPMNERMWWLKILRNSPKRDPN